MQHPSTPGRSRLFAETTGYVSPEESRTRQAAKKGIYPAIGDTVRFFDIDGGKTNGQLLIGRITFIQKNLGNEGSGWTVEITELDDVGAGYYADYPLQQKRNKRTTRDLAAVSPVTASFVRSEAAYKIPLDANGNVRVRAEQYDYADYEGPMANLKIDQNVVQADALLYGNLKSKILRFAALTGLFGTIATDLSYGTQDAAIYFGGVVASLLYLFFLTVKTDTLASTDAKFGSNISNLRFLTPLILVAAIAGYNKSLGDVNPVLGGGTFELVTTEQFAAATLGFLTYRIPLFLTQISDAFKEEIDDTILPGSIGIAAQMAQEQSRSSLAGDTGADTSQDLATVLLISGPQATGRSSLVKKFIEEGNGKYIQPKMIDRMTDGAKFDRLQSKQKFLYIDPTERYGLTKDAISAAAENTGPESVVVVDADVDLAKKISETKGLRLIGVWVGLGTIKDFETRIQEMIDQEVIEIPPEDSRESVTRAKTKEIVQEIEFGITSGLFEFTILNDDTNKSLRELREAAAYCFK